MKIIFTIVLSLFISSVLSGVPCSNSVLVCANENENCLLNKTNYPYCTYPLFCDTSANYTCQKKGGIPGQPCTIDSDCDNIDSSYNCNGSHCVQNVGVFGINEPCTYNHECVTGLNCSSGFCALKDLYCNYEGSCPYGQFCNRTGKVNECSNQSAVGEACRSGDGECRGLSTCINKYCTAPHSGAVGSNCSKVNNGEIVCGGCTACSGGKCVAELQVNDTWGTQECNASSSITLNPNCTVGVGYCGCEPSSTELRCQVKEQAKSYGGCAEFIQAYESCLEVNKCNVLTQRSPKWIYFITLFSQPSGCASACSAHYSCYMKCKQDVDKNYGSYIFTELCGNTQGPFVNSYSCATVPTNPNNCPGTTSPMPGVDTGSQPSGSGTQTTVTQTTVTQTTGTQTTGTQTTGSGTQTNGSSTSASTTECKFNIGGSCLIGSGSFLVLSSILLIFSLFI
jgi:hypothetical protein